MKSAWGLNGRMNRTFKHVWILRNMLADYSPMETMKFLRDKTRNSETNEEFLGSMSKVGQG